MQQHQTESSVTYAHQHAQVRRLANKVLGKIEIKKSSTGRPFVDAGRDVSLSHTDRAMAVATILAPYIIGVDVEDRDIPLHVRSLFSHEEVELCESLSPKGVWACKEAVCKCLDVPFTQTKISQKDGRLVGSGNNRYVALSLRLTQGHALAVAVTKKGLPPGALPPYPLRFVEETERPAAEKEPCMGLVAIHTMNADPQASCFWKPQRLQLRIGPIPRPPDQQ